MFGAGHNALGGLGLRAKRKNRSHRRGSPATSAAFGGHSATLVGAAALTAIGAYALRRAHRAFTTEAAAG